MPVKPAGCDQHVRHDDVALHIDKPSAGFGLQPGDQSHRDFDFHLAGTHRQHQPFDIPLGQQFKRLFANGQGAGAHGRTLFGVSRYGLQLQAQAFAQVPRAYACGF